MFVLPLKTGPRVDIKSSLIQWLDDPEDPSTDLVNNPLDFILPKPKYRSAQIMPELTRLQSLRNDVLLSLPKADAHAHALANRALEDAMEYHATLLAFEQHGFTSQKCCGSGTITYHGAFAITQSESHGSLVWDRAVTVYNMAALLMYQAASHESSVTTTGHHHDGPEEEDRDSIKRAISHCQQAAYLLQTCNELCTSMSGTFSTVDLSSPLLTVACSNCLAYAQSCICKLMMLGSSPSKSSLSMLHQATHCLYNVVLEQAQDPRLKSDIPQPAQEWAAEAKLHSMVHAIYARWMQSQVFREEYKYGIEIACLRVCQEQCQALSAYLATTTTNNAFLSPAALNAIRDYRTVAAQVQDRYTEVFDDNRRNYHEVIPQSTPPLESRQLAKPAASLPVAMLQPSQPLLFQPLGHVHVVL